MTVDCYISWVVYGGGGTNHYSSMVVARALQLGLCQQHLTQLRKTYSVSRDTCFH